MKHILFRVGLSIGAVLIANAAALLLAASAVEIVRGLYYPETISWDASIQTLALFSIFGSVLFFDTVFPVSLMLALLGLALRWHSPRIYIGGAAAIGLGFYFFRLSHLSSGNEDYLLTSVLIGAICGWIYWRIAIGRTPPDDHAIKAA